MRPARGAVGLALLVAAQLAAGPIGLGASAASTQDPSTTISVQLDARTQTARLGQRIGFTSTIRNAGDASSAPTVAHLNVLSLDPDVTVDPEDWSPDRTHYLGPLSPNSSTPLEWSVHAVNTGPILLYVTVTEPSATDVVSASPTLRLQVAPQERLTGPGALPLALGVPAALLVLAGLVMWRRRVRSRPQSVNADAGPA